MPFEEKCGSAVKAFFVNKVATADSKREFWGISMNDIKMNSDKLEKIKEDWMVKGEDYPLKTCIMEWGIWVFYEV